MSGSATLVVAQGFHPPGTQEFVYPCYSWSSFLGPNACINRVVVLIFLVLVVVLALFVLAFSRAKVVPRGLQNVMEAGVDFIRNQIILEVIGPDGLRFLPYLTTLFFFVFFGNLLGIIPLINFPVNSRMAVPLFLAIVTWGLFNWVGIREQGFGRYVRNTLFPSGIPWPLYLLIAPIEFVSVQLVRPVTLSVRLLANMVAGHLILTVFFLATAYMLSPLLSGRFSILSVFAVGSFALSVILVGFELLVAALQAYIFTILNAVYLAGALEPEH